MDSLVHGLVVGVLLGVFWFAGRVEHGAGVDKADVVVAVDEEGDAGGFAAAGSEVEFFQDIPVLVDGDWAGVANAVGGFEDGFVGDFARRFGVVDGYDPQALGGVFFVEFLDGRQGGFAEGAGVGPPAVEGDGVGGVEGFVIGGLEPAGEVLVGEGFIEEVEAGARSREGCGLGGWGGLEGGG